MVVSRNWFIFKNVQASFIVTLMNLDPLSVAISCGIPYRKMKFSTKDFATETASLFFRVYASTNLVNSHYRVSIYEYPFISVGSGPTMSKNIF